MQSRYLEPADGAVTTPAPTVTAAPTATPAPDVDVPQDGGYARVRLSSASSRLNLRASASTSSAIVAKLGHGETVRVLAVSGSWVRVETASGQTGYVQSRYLEPADGAVATPAPTATAAPTATPAPDTGEMTEMDGEVYADIYVSASGGSLHVRQGPSTQTPSVTTVSHGSWVQVLAVGGEWARVRTRLGNEGYLKVKYLVPRGDSAAPTQSDMIACDLRATAAQSTPARTRPAADAAVVATIPAGTPLYVKAYDDDWAHVFSVSGASSGYVLKAHLRLYDETNDLYACGALPGAVLLPGGGAVRGRHGAADRAGLSARGDGRHARRRAQFSDRQRSGGHRRSGRGHPAGACARRRDLQAGLSALHPERYPAGPLKSGSTGEDVRAMQRALRDLGYYQGQADGVFGEGTRAAVTAFQTANGLAASGEADRAMLLLLHEGQTLTWQDFLAGKLCQRGDFPGAGVRSLQRRLKQMGYFDGECTDAFGDSTQRAVERFQEQNGLEVTGAADEATCRLLYSGSGVSLTDDGVLRQGDAGESVAELQQLLHALGYLPAENDGAFGADTYVAVVLYQIASGLTPTGEADAALVESLRSPEATPLSQAKRRCAPASPPWTPRRFPGPAPWPRNCPGRPLTAARTPIIPAFPLCNTSTRAPARD